MKKQQQQKHNLFSRKGKHFLEQLSAMCQQFWVAITVAIKFSGKM